MLAKLLERLVPAIFADPERLRTCRECGRPVPPADLVDWYYCSDECSFVAFGNSMP